ncbi:MAG TPA: flagellar basal body P-ring protein FlgI [Gemmataceae bacterium]|nr:flagellar basal body P-ring protein FlgI [Gemmataceae bacterium]
MPRTGTKLAITLALLAATMPAARAAGTRIKDITEFEGARSNQLTGVGLVVGLENTGGRSLLTQQMAVDMLSRFRVNTLINSNSNLAPVYRAFSVSVVAVTAELGPFARRGSKMDVLVSVMDDALSLQGGTLIFTPLRGADDVVYAVAQGPLSIGGFQFTVPQGSSTPLASAQKNHPTVGRIPSGAIIEREARGDVVCNGTVRLLLRDPDYTTACAIGRAINARFPHSAIPLDAGTVQVFVPRDRLLDVVCWAGEVGQLEVTPDIVAKVVINERTGTIVAGKDVQIDTIAVAHGNLAILTSDEPFASQPPPFSGGTTAILPRPRIGVTEQGGALRVLDHTTTVADLARALNLLGVTPRDMISIFQAIAKAGALHAELVIM